MATITPNPGDLGITSIQLGPWFTNAVNLALPADGDLSVSIAGGSDWLPPVNGLLSLVLPQSTTVDGEQLPHRSLVHLKNADGTLRFANVPDKLVAVFTVLPEVHIRLQQLYLNHADERLGSSSTQSPKRPVPYQFVLEVDAPTDLSALNNLVDENVSDTDVAATLGLVFDSGNFQNAASPMAWLRKVVASASNRPYLIRIPASGASLLIYDAEGMPVDPGMVVSVFSALTTEYDNLWGGGGSPSFPTTATGKVLHLVDTFSKAPSSEWQSALRINGSSVSAAVSTFTATTLALSFDATALTTRPFLRHAILPHSPYQTTTDVPSAELFDRDYFRIALTDIEQLLTGQTRTPAFDSSTKNWQALASTRIQLAKHSPTGSNPIFLTHHESVLRQAHTLLGNADPAIVVTSQWNGSNGAINDISLPDVALPDRISALRLFPAQGGQGPDDPDHPTQARAMRAVLQVDLPDTLTGAWIRALPLGFDLDTGIRTQLSGAGGLAIAAGDVARATLLVTLPPGDAVVDSDDQVAFDVEIVTSRGKRLLGTQQVNRVDRPASTSTAITINSATFPSGVNSLYVCETGQRISAGGALQLPNGLTLVAELPDDQYAVVDTSTTPYSVFNNSVGQQLTNADVVVTTDRIWQNDPQGDTESLLTPTSATLVNSGRNGLGELLEAGAPIPLMERNETIVTTASNGNTATVAGGVPLVTPFHELSPPRPGQAGQSAAADVHAVGAHVQGPAANLLREIALDRRFKETPALLSHVIDSTFPTPPTEPSGAQAVVAALRTVAAQVEGEIQMHIRRTPSLLNNITDYDYTDSLSDKRSHINGISPGLLSLPNLPPASNTAARQRMERFLDRRVRGATEGYREVIPTLKYWLEQAQQFIYVETPVLSAGLGLPDDDELRLVQLLRSSLVNNPNLYVLVCVPLQVNHPLGAMRHYYTGQNQAAIEALRPVTDGTTTTSNPTAALPANQRIAFFSPYGAGYRPLDIKTTTVIADDVVALTGPLGLSRRGLTFDASVATAIFDERLQAGRSQEVFRFRQALIADRLRLNADLLPAKGSMLVPFIREVLRAGFNQNVTRPKPPTRPDLGTGDSFAAQFDPDGRYREGFNVATYLTGLIADAIIRPALAD